MQTEPITFPTDPDWHNDLRRRILRTVLVCGFLTLLFFLWLWRSTEGTLPPALIVLVLAAEALVGWLIGWAFGARTLILTQDAVIIAGAGGLGTVGTHLNRVKDIEVHRDVTSDQVREIRLKLSGPGFSMLRIWGFSRLDDALTLIENSMAEIKKQG